MLSRVAISFSTFARFHHRWRLHSTRLYIEVAISISTAGSHHVHSMLNERWSVSGNSLPLKLVLWVRVRREVAPCHVMRKCRCICVRACRCMCIGTSACVWEGSRVRECVHVYRQVHVLVCVSVCVCVCVCVSIKSLEFKFFGCPKPSRVK